MSWIIFVIIAVVVTAIVIFIDNYISDVYFKGRDAASQKYFFTFAYLIAGLITLLIFGINFSVASPLTYIIILGSGIIISVANIFYYRALEIDNSTNLGIFIQLAPILYLVFGWMFFGDTISPLQLVAFAVILSAPILIILTARKRSRKVKIRAVLFTFLYVAIAVAGNLLFAKFNNPDINFGTEIALVFLGKGIGNSIIMLFKPDWRRRFRSVVQSTHKKVLLPLSIDFILNLIKDFTYRSALVLAPSIALASAASDSAEPIVIFFMGLLLTLIWPKFGREKLNRKSVVVHLIATILVVTGIILIQL
ncbi:EamA family transporter [Candidatus Saccharibacteria bacterium]|nr:EamA family transporter [Candidatus Saccharibacteria bacterium]